jgi:hypothetical protein
MYESCENAAKHLATNIANESVSVVKLKWGNFDIYDKVYN